MLRANSDSISYTPCGKVSEVPLNDDPVIELNKLLEKLKTTVDPEKIYATSFLSIAWELGGVCHVAVPLASEVRTLPAPCDPCECFRCIASISEVIGVLLLAVTQAFPFASFTQLGLERVFCFQKRYRNVCPNTTVSSSVVGWKPLIGLLFGPTTTQYDFVDT